MRKILKLKEKTEEIKELQISEDTLRKLRNKKRKQLAIVIFLASNSFT